MPSELGMLVSFPEIALIFYRCYFDVSPFLALPVFPFQRLRDQELTLVEQRQALGPVPCGTSQTLTELPRSTLRNVSPHDWRLSSAETWPFVS